MISLSYLLCITVYILTFATTVNSMLPMLPVALYELHSSQITPASAAMTAYAQAEIPRATEHTPILYGCRNHV